MSSKILSDLWGPYRTILADPPWAFATRSAKGQGRSASQHYRCLSLDDIRALPVSGQAARDAVLLLWVPKPMLPWGIDLMGAWGFDYKTIAFNWVKTQKRNPPPPWSLQDFFKGMGYWTRANAELCLLGQRGQARRKPTATNVDELIIAPRREHSRKPDVIYERIEALCEGPYLELFARTQRPGWDAFGNEVDKFDTGEVAPKTRPAANRLRLLANAPNGARPHALVPPRRSAPPQKPAV